MDTIKKFWNLNFLRKLNLGFFLNKLYSSHRKKPISLVVQPPHFPNHSHCHFFSVTVTAVAVSKRKVWKLDIKLNLNLIEINENIVNKNVLKKL